MLNKQLLIEQQIKLRPSLAPEADSLTIGTELVQTRLFLCRTMKFLNFSIIMTIFQAVQNKHFLIETLDDAEGFRFQKKSYECRKLKD